MSEDIKQGIPASTQVSEAGMKIPQMIRSAQYRNVYANNLGFSLNNADFTIMFAANTSIPGFPATIVQEEVAVTIPFVVLKVMAEVLPKVVEELEKEMGPIRIPKAARPSEQMITALIASIKSANLVE